VLLDADPLADITNTTTIRAVVANGRYYDRAALDSFVGRDPGPGPKMRRISENGRVNRPRRFSTPPILAGQIGSPLGAFASRVRAQPCGR
jgi:hypothetical protein